MSERTGSSPGIDDGAMEESTIPAVYVHPSAIVETSEIGPGTQVWAFAHVLAGARVGGECNLGDHCYIEGGVVIGDRCTIKNQAFLCEGVELHAGVFVGPGVTFTNDSRPRSRRHPANVARYASKRDWLRRVVVREGASIGARSVLLPGIEIGRWALRQHRPAGLLQLLPE